MHLCQSSNTCVYIFSSQISLQIYIMPTRCVIAGCSNTPTSEGVSLHRFPKDEALRKIWATKVRLTRAKWFAPSLVSVIFSDLWFYRWRLHGEFGMSKALRLKKTLIPTKIKKPVNPSNDKPNRRSDALVKCENRQEVRSDMSDIHVCTCMYMYVHVHVHVHVCTCTCTCTYMYVHVLCDVRYTCMYMYCVMYDIYMYMYVHVLCVPCWVLDIVNNKYTA